MLRPAGRHTIDDLLHQHHLRPSSRGCEVRHRIEDDALPRRRIEELLVRQLCAPEPEGREPLVAVTDGQHAAELVVGHGLGAVVVVVLHEGRGQDDGVLRHVRRERPQVDDVGDADVGARVGERGWVIAEVKPYGDHGEGAGVADVGGGCRRDADPLVFVDEEFDVHVAC